jgi:hypothetical protein
MSDIDFPQRHAFSISEDRLDGARKNKTEYDRASQQWEPKNYQVRIGPPLVDFDAGK